jgi:hypothetical protein
MYRKEVPVSALNQRCGRARAIRAVEIVKRGESLGGKGKRSHGAQDDRGFRAWPH